MRTVSVTAGSARGHEAPLRPRAVVVPGAVVRTPVGVLSIVAVVIAGMAAGVMYPIETKQVLSTGTAATGITAFF